MNVSPHTPPYSCIENSALFIAVIVLGVMAGFFWTYTFNVNYALLQLDGVSYAKVQSLLNVNVRHPMFFTFFFGSGFCSVLAVLLNLRHWRDRSILLLLAATLIYIFGVIVYTRFVNLPLNYYTESWDPTNLPNDWQQVRQQWNNANENRVATSFSAFLLSALALLFRTFPTHKNKR